MNKQSQCARRCRGPLYKQTQSGAAQVVSAGQFCQTKPIPPVGRGAEGERCKTKPNLGALGYLGAGRAGPSPEPIVQNKANLGKPGQQNRQGRLCKTKPIRVPAALGEGRQGCPCRWRDRVVQTKPICPGRTGRAAKRGPVVLPQTDTNVQNEANFRPGSTRRMWNMPPYAGRTRHAPICGRPLAAACGFGYKNGVFRRFDGPDDGHSLRTT
jgi:hypothetical protein